LISQFERPSIQGYIILQRKNTWVKRYAQIDGPNGLFYYKNNENDSNEKRYVDLRNSKIKKGIRNLVQ
jgi:hypothetical protein